MSLYHWRHDPGPCPVDDAAHHTCTSADYVPPSGGIVVPSGRMRARLAREQQAREREAREPPAPQEFTTVTYERKKVRRR
jgi:hypothetical protein